jgi:hypothetical protein
MANEIYQSFDSASVLYALIYRASDGYIYDAGDEAFEAIGTWNDARAEECDIPMTAIGDLHFADFPVVAAGNYILQIRLQAGGSPDTDDIPLAQGFMNWDGTAESLSSDIEILYEKLVNQMGAVQSNNQGSVHNTFTSQKTETGGKRITGL